MPRHAPELECSAEDKGSLVAITKSRIEEARAVERARIILACLEGKEIRQVARELGISIPTVTKWRRRFALWGLRGLRDQPRPGKPVSTTPLFATGYWRCWSNRRRPACRIGMGRQWQRNSTAASTPSGVFCAARESTCGGCAASVDTTVCGRMLSNDGNHQGWCVSTDKEFGPKAAEVVGLYLTPPLNAVVLSVDEKPSIQAIERSSGYVETDSGAIVRALKGTYKRYGTLNLFAALEVGTGQVHTKFTDYKKRQDFQSFLDG